MSRLTAEEMRADIVALFSPAHRPVEPGRIGVELEQLWVTAVPGEMSGGVPGVVRLQEGTSVPALVEFLQAYGERTERLAAAWDEHGMPSFRTAREGRVCFEPGGQLEYITEPRTSAREVADDLRAVLDPLEEAAREVGIETPGLGMNPYHDAAEVGLQLPTPRYQAMDRHFEAMGPYGRQMMRLTASLQVNLDFGDPRQAKARWRAANLLGPVCTAAFANSPFTFKDGTKALSGRALIWQRADETRTGMAIGRDGSDFDEPWRAYRRFALNASVMLRFGEDGEWRGAVPRFRFADWWAGSVGAPPSAEEWRVHLDTLFPEVRPRGWLEVRGIDSPRPEWRGVPLTLLPALLYDDAALARILSMLEPHAGGLPALWRRAALFGVSDPVLGDLAEEVFRVALEAAERLPEEYFGADLLAATRAFQDRFVRRRRTQANETAAD